MFKGLKNLCTPAYLYFLVSAICLLALLIQNLQGGSTYRCGMYKAEVGNVPMIFIGKVIYVLFWTVVLDALCKTGYKNLSWLLVLFPFILFAMALVGLTMRRREGMDIGKQWKPHAAGEDEDDNQWSHVHTEGGSWASGSSGGMSGGQSNGF